MMFFFFNDTATTEIYTLSLHDALPISSRSGCLPSTVSVPSVIGVTQAIIRIVELLRSEEHTSELQSPCNLVCRLLLDKIKNQTADSEMRLRLRTVTVPYGLTARPLMPH